jgi:hypothetical protein
MRRLFQKLMLKVGAVFEIIAATLQKLRQFVQKSLKVTVTGRYDTIKGWLLFAQ